MNRRLVTGVVVAAVVAGMAVPSGAGGYPRPGQYTQVDLTNGGQWPGGHTSYHTSISASGRFVAFDSDAPLTPGTGGGYVPGGTQAPPSNVFVRDLATGRTQLLSQPIGGLNGGYPICDVAGAIDLTVCAVDGYRPYGHAVSFDPKISPDGRYVAFTSFARLVSSQPTTEPAKPIANVFVSDRVTQHTTLVSVPVQGSAGVAQQSRANGFSFSSSISADGRYVSFTSAASNLVPGDTNGMLDVFVRDVKTAKTVRVSVSSTGAQATCGTAPPAVLPVVLPGVLAAGDCYFNQFGVGYKDPLSSISVTGQYVAFDYYPSNLVPNDTNGMTDVYVHDLRTRKTIRVSVASGGAQAEYNPVQGTKGFGNEGCQLTNANTNVVEHAISTDGRYVSFICGATNLVPNETTWSFNQQAYVHDVRTDRTYAVEVHPDGSACTGSGTSSGQGGSADSAAISTDGRYVVYHASLCNPSPSCPNEGATGVDGPNRCELFVYDRVTGQVDGLPETRGGQAYRDHGQSYPNFGQLEADISGDGRYVSTQWQYSAGASACCNYSAFVWDRGAPVLVGGLAASGKLTVADAPSFASTGLISAAGPASLAQALTAEGADLIGASVAYRPTYGDLFARLELQQMPTFAAANPALVYGFRLTINGGHYEVRAAKGGSDALTGGGASFGLYRLSQGAWAKVATLHGGYGTTGAEVTVAVPLRDLGVQGGGRLSDVSAFTGLGAYDAGAAQLLDQVVLAGASR
jgi:hypothetical protein